MGAMALVLEPGLSKELLEAEIGKGTWSPKPWS